MVQPTIKPPANRNTSFLFLFNLIIFILLSSSLVGDVECVTFRGAALPLIVYQSVGDVCSGTLVIGVESAEPTQTQITPSALFNGVTQDAGASPFIKLTIYLKNIPPTGNQPIPINVTVTSTVNSLVTPFEIYCIKATNERFDSFNSYYQDIGQFSVAMVGSFRGRFLTKQTQQDYGYSYTFPGNDSSCFRIQGLSAGYGDLYPMMLIAVPSLACKYNFFNNVSVTVIDGNGVTNESSVTIQTITLRAKGNRDNCTFMSYRQIGNIQPTYLKNTFYSFGQFVGDMHTFNTNLLSWVGLYGQSHVNTEPIPFISAMQGVYIQFTTIAANGQALMAMSLSLNNQPNLLSYDYPFGISGSMNNLTETYLLYYPNQAVPPEFTCNANQTIHKVIIPNRLNTPIPGPSLPIINDLIINRMKTKVVLMIRASSIYGILSITVNGLYYLEERHLVSGNITDGWFEATLDCSTFVFVSENSYTFRVYDRAYRQGNYFSNMFVQTLAVIPFPLIATVNDIQSIVFSPNVIDVSNMDVQVTLSVSFKSLDIANRLPSPIFLPNSDQLLNGPPCPPVWNDRLQQYQFNITVPRNTFEGPYPYTLVFESQYLLSAILAPLFGPQSILTIISPAADRVLPLITDLSQVLEQSDGQFIMYWNFTIQDEPNGFDHGIVNVTSNKDYKPYTFVINQSTRKSGTKFNGVYQISLTTGSPMDQTFTFDNVELCDTCGNCGSSSKPITMDPLAMIRNTDQFAAASKFVFNNSPLSGSSNIPVGTLTLTKNKVDVSGTVSQRTVGVTLTVVDLDGLEMSARHTPIIYVQSLASKLTQPNQPLSFEAILDVSQVGYVYKAQIVLPYGYGNKDYPIIFSAHGFANTKLTFGQALNVTLERDFLNSTIYIDSCSIAQNVVTVIGNNLYGATAIFDPPIINLLSDEPPYWVIFQSSTMLQINMTATPTQTFNLFARRIITSNACLINVQQAPNNTNVTCPSSCGPNGYCSGTNCICNPGWSGVTCMSTIINVNTTFNATNPSVETVDVDSTIKSIISIVAIQEIDPTNDQVIRSYPFTTWNSSNQLDSRIRYFYRSHLVDPVDTNLPIQTTIVKVTIEEFNATTNYTFANQLLLMVPGSIKYTIELDGYQFSSQVSTLRLLMSTTIQSTDGNACLSSDQGPSGGGGSPTIDSNWFSLRVNEKSIFGRFIKVGIVDNRLMSITTSFIQQEQQNDNINQLIAINIPNFNDNVILDPDFSFLISNSGNDCSKKNGLSVQQIAGIVVGSVVAAVLVTAAVIYILKKKYSIKFSRKRLVVIPLETRA
ncbi:hypothetical protein DFA_01185 [Cavenderia fasciculata]|uniref:EGF-like domain-containing protein n=1 Tax=Cavenderia fasciculata TaxID=261658 RepID=F4PRA4_CACFS|nr:uncharacterized protein DFA_01185 [Cavenderia fasciculata]EGG21304.1 hypothetical protein DFA_01185 [Cavenderia fasciculata]|eukprot:XP_004359154.1 hypothetical protein DFA_01185 [Cavenderia fasciculata]